MAKIKAENAERFVRHCRVLASLRLDPKNLVPSSFDFWDGLKLYNKLRRIELKANRMYVQFCNVGYTDEERDKFDNKITKAVMALLPNLSLLHLNGDPRGYALKIDFDESPAFADTARDIQRDSGGFGILAPEF